MQRTQYDGKHQYIATPSEYPISANENHSTYDQFIQLRDTLIFTGKYYNDKASRKLCVGDKGDGSTTNTIEVWLPNYFRQGFQSTWPSGDFTTGILGSYISEVPTDLVSQYQFPVLSCMIQKDGHYRIMHKEEILLDSTTDKVFCYVDVYRKNSNDVYEIIYKGGVAVFDWEGAGGDYTLGDLFKKMTAIAEQERDLLKGDILVLRMQDGTYDATTGEPTGNNLTLQQDSNYWSIEYLDLPYNI